MGGGAVSDTGLSPIDEMRLRAELEAKPRGKKEATEARSKNMQAVLEMLPVSGNYLAGEAAVDDFGRARENFKDLELHKAAGNAALGGLNAVGAVVGMPWGAAAGKAAKGAASRLNTFVPVEEGKLSELARDMRERGASNEEVFRHSGLFFGPDGTMRRTIPDRMRMDTNYKPGDKTTVGALVDHPRLFREMPELQNRVVNVTDDLDRYAAQMGRRKGVVNTDPVTDEWNMSVAGGNPYADIAKLLQYDITKKVGFSQAGRHRYDDQLQDINTAQLRASMADADPAAVSAYVKHLEDEKGRVIGNKSGVAPGRGQRKQKDMSMDFMNRNAGSTDAKIVRGQVYDKGSERVYPYATQNAPWIGGGYVAPGFENLTVLPPTKMTKEDWTMFLEDWHRFGSGKGR